MKVKMKPANALKHYLNIRDFTLLKLKNGVIYQINCEDSGQSYIGETGRFFSIRCQKYMRDVDGWKPNRSVLSTHAISNDHKINWVNIKILAQENGYCKRKFMESLFINKCDSTMNIEHNIKRIFSFTIRLTSMALIVCCLNL